MAWTGIEHFRMGRYDPPPPPEDPEDFVVCLDMFVVLCAGCIHVWCHLCQASYELGCKIYRHFRVLRL